MKPLFAGLGAGGHDPGVVGGDPAPAELLPGDAVDDVLLLALPRARVVGADDVHPGGGLAPLHHVDDVVRVGQVEPGPGTSH